MVDLNCVPSDYASQMTEDNQELRMTQPAAQPQYGDIKKPGQSAVVMGLGIVFIGTLLHTVGSITRGWIVIPELDVRYGLFSWDTNTSGALISVRVFAILGIILGVATLVMCGIYLKFSDLFVRRKAATLILVSGIGAGGSSLISALIFALEFYFHVTKVTNKNYSFALCIVGGILIATGGIVTFLGARQSYRAMYFTRQNLILNRRLGRHPSQQSMQGQDNMGIWHTQQYSEPPPSYHQLQLSDPSLPKQGPPIDTLPPSYAEAVKWYSNNELS